MAIVNMFFRLTVFIAAMVSMFYGAATFAGDNDLADARMPLHEILEIVTKTNPEILEAMEQYRSVKAERSIATSGYWPTVGTELSAGPEVTDGLDTNNIREDLTAATATLYARQNLFNGGGHLLSLMKPTPAFCPQPMK